MNAQRKKKRRRKRSAQPISSANAESSIRPSEKSGRSKHKPANALRLRRWLYLLVVVLLLGVVAKMLFDSRRANQLQNARQQLAEAQRRGDWERVEVLARDWVMLEPEAYQPWQAAADAALQMDRPRSAVQYLESMPDGGPLNSYLQLGLLQMEALADPLAAKATCDETLKYYPEDPETHARLLYYYTMTGQRNQITAEARRALELGCDTLATYAYLFGAKWLTFTNGYETNQMWLQRYPGHELFEVGSVVHMPSYVFLDLLAKEQMQTDEEPRPLEYAAKAVAELRKKYPQNLELLAIETRNLCRAGELEEVGKRLALQVPGMAEDNRFWRFKGWYYSTLEQWDAAEKSYRQALELEPFDWTTQLEMAALIRATQGIEASAEMQLRADTGKQLMMGVQKCPVLHQLEPVSLYDDMQDYFRMCGQPELADRLGRRLKASRH